MAKRYGQERAPFQWLQGLLISLVAAVSVLLNTSFDAPPRYDGAGYATLGWGLSQGYGYRDWQHPDAPDHSHFPPGYPLLLSLLFHGVGRSVAVPHVLSVVLTVLAVLLTWLWIQSLYARSAALLLGLGLAINWTWGRTGGMILSEPLFLCLSSAALMLERRGRDRGFGVGIGLGLLLGACILTRHVGVCLALALVLDLLLRRRFASALATLLAMSAILLPWVGWLASSRGQTQAGLFEGGNFLGLIFSQALFYIRRIPDQILGPGVEIATVFSRSPVVSMVATGWAILITALIIWGWLRTLRNPERRLVALVPFCTLPLLLIWPFTEAGRFLIPLVPFLLIGLMEGIAPRCVSLGSSLPRTRAAALILLASMPYPLYAAATSRALAQERTHAAFDAACAWVIAHGNQAGPVATHYAADLSWQTGRQSLEINPADLGAFLAKIEHYGVAYVIPDEQPFANAQADPSAVAMKKAPERFRLVWGPTQGVSIYEVLHERTRGQTPQAQPAP